MISVVPAGSDQFPTVLQLVHRLLVELAEDPTEFAGWDLAQVQRILEGAGDRFAAFLAHTPTGEAIGVATLTEAIAAYAQGRYGIISELYVAPAHRGQGVGRLLLEAVKGFGHERGWSRLDVTAPPEASWVRTVDFYQQNGFVFSGPKLRFQFPAVRAPEP